MAAASFIAVVFPLAGLVGGSQVLAQCAVALAVIQGSRRYGWRLLIAFFVICYVVSSFWETLSVLTGFPFGNYTYTLMPQLFNVPVIIGVTYFGIGWVSWMVTNAILDRPDERLDLRTRVERINAFALPLLSGALMSMWDLGADSLISTVRGVWIWEDGGGVFGAPFTNYIGWWFVTWSFFQIFTLVLAFRQTRRPAGTHEILPQVSYLQPVLAVHDVRRLFRDDLHRGARARDGDRPDGCRVGRRCDQRDPDGHQPLHHPSGGDLRIGEDRARGHRPRVRFERAGTRARPLAAPPYHSGEEGAVPKITAATVAEHKERTRDLLLDAVESLVLERPFASVSMRDIAERASVSRTVIYNDAPDPISLLVEATQRGSAEVRAAVAEQADQIAVSPRVRLRRIVTVLLLTTPGPPTPC